MSTFLVIRRYGKKVMLGGIVVTAVAAWFWYRSVQAPGEEGAALPPSPLLESQAEMVTRDFRHVETKMNRTLWILEASLAEIFEKNARLIRVKITYYGGGEKPTVITGRQARVDLSSWDAVLYGDIRALHHDGTVMKTRKLEWNNKAQTLTAPWPIRIRSRYGEIRGSQMTAKMDENWVRIDGRVDTVFHPPGGFLEPAI